MGLCVADSEGSLVGVSPVFYHSFYTILYVSYNISFVHTRTHAHIDIWIKENAMFYRNKLLCSVVFPCKIVMSQSINAVIDEQITSVGNKCYCGKNYLDFQRTSPPSHSGDRGLDFRPWHSLSQLRFFVTHFRRWERTVLNHMPWSHLSTCFPNRNIYSNLIQH